MSARGSKKPWRMGNCLGMVFLAGILVLGFSAGVLGQQIPPAGKAVYCNGSAYLFSPISGGRLQASQYAWNGYSLEQQAYVQWSANPVGSLGVCVFNNKIYGFYTTADNGGSLYYVTVDPASGNATAGPTLVIAGGSNVSFIKPGISAAVAGGRIFLFSSSFMAPQRYLALVSNDGAAFSCFSYTCANSSAPEVLDAVTFEPSSGDPESIMLVYYDTSANPPALGASIFSFAPNWQPSDVTSTQDFTLPWESGWNPLAQGSLLLGTNGGFNGTAAGYKGKCIQFYGYTNPDGGTNQGRWEYQVAEKTWTLTDITWNVMPDACQYLVALPWFETMDAISGTMQQSHLLYYHSNYPDLLTDIQFSAGSDWMIPQNNDPNYGWAGTPTPTANASIGSDLQKLWTLVGVVLGPPPFATNGASTACPDYPDVLSWVNYGKDVSHTITTTSTSSTSIMVAVDNTIKAGVARFSIDASYAHAWTSMHGTSTTVSVSANYAFSPCLEQPGSQGTSGWAIFSAPTIVSQWYKLYAYDQSTYLNEDVYATALGDSTLQTAYFELANPSQGEYPGLFAGMPAYPNSTDLSGWHLNIPNWDGGGSNWTTVFGDTTSPPVGVLNLGVREEEVYTQSTTTMTSKGNSNSFDVSASAGQKMPLNGWDKSLTIGVSGQYTTNTENDSTVTVNVTCGLNVPIPPDQPGYVNTLTVQPFWLQANSPDVPWVPANTSDAPWCITWGVTQYSTYTSSGSATAGVAAAPASASGTIRHGGENGKDTYTLVGGHLAWLNADGTETPIPITADQFDTSKGALVYLNGHVFSADGSKGKWSRSGETWTYKAGKGAKGDRFTLGLDFASGTWSFDCSSKSLDQELKAADSSVQVRLVVQGQYGFTEWLKHDVHAAWSHSEKKGSWQQYGVHEVKGDYDSPTNAGHLTLKGHIPKDAKSFGDLEIRVNGAPVLVPLLSTPGSLQALQKRGKVKVQAEGLSFDIDFGAGKWEAAIEGAQFKADMAPKRGAMRIQVFVGGFPLSDQIFVLQKCTTGLSYSG